MPDTEEFRKQLFIRSLVKLTDVPLNDDSTTYVCAECTPPKFQTKAQRALPARVVMMNVWNFSVPPPALDVLHNLKPHERYLIQRDVVIMHIQNFGNDPNRPHASRSKGHACLLPLDPAHTLSEYNRNTKPPRNPEELEIYVEQQTTGELWTFTVSSNVRTALERLLEFSQEYADLSPDDILWDRFDEYEKGPSIINHFSCLN